MPSCLHHTPKYLIVFAFCSVLYTSVISRAFCQDRKLNLQDLPSCCRSSFATLQKQERDFGWTVPPSATRRLARRSFRPTHLPRRSRGNAYSEPSQLPAIIKLFHPEHGTESSFRLASHPDLLTTDEDTSEDLPSSEASLLVDESSASEATSFLQNNSVLDRDDLLIDEDLATELLPTSETDDLLPNAPQSPFANQPFRDQPIPTNDDLLTDEDPLLLENRESLDSENAEMETPISNLIDSDWEERRLRRNSREQDPCAVAAAQHACPPDPHLEVFAKNMYPSAEECGKCHETHYREWSVSAHAYASISPMFQKFEQAINDLSKGTIHYFCLRCHSPIATAMKHPRDKSIWDSIPAAQEGVTCIVCHRVVERYGKVNGERRIETGSLFAPVVGSGCGSKLAEVLARKDHYKVKTSPDQQGPGQEIHTNVIQFEQISKSSFCVSCHQVAVYPGIKLEIVWEQYRASPACKQGIRCQDCHMGIEPGKPSGFASGPTAIVGGKEVNPNRKHSNHMFVGPGYSIAHPGTFPFNPEAKDWTPYEWLKFNWRAGWGTESFEEKVDRKEITVRFPKTWENSDDRMDAREIIQKNLKLLATKKRQRFLLMETNSKIEGPYLQDSPRKSKPLRFHYVVRNLNSGHHLPSGSLGAQPQLWLNVALTDPYGERIWESGYVDANGDVADMHSLEVAAGNIEPDHQLFNLQTKFLITHVKGPDREMYLPINTDFDQLPFIRPSGFPIANLNHPPFIRLETHSIPPLGSKKAKYSVPAHLLKKRGRYRLSVRMRSRAEPIYFMRFCKSTPEMERSMNERMLDYHQHAFEFFVK